jgi:hypothetical protein
VLKTDRDKKIPFITVRYANFLQIYEDINMRKMCGMVIEENRQAMFMYIQQLGGTGLPPKFFFGLLDNMENMA